MKKKLSQYDQRSFKALMARGFDIKLSQQLVNDGYTISKLKSKTVTELKSLGIEDSHARELKRNKRPPIPTKTVANPASTISSISFSSSERLIET